MSMQDSPLDRAIALHQRGELEQAEIAYGQVLAAHPRDASALHLLGLLRAGKGALAEAEAMMRQAVGIDSRYAEAHNNLGNVLCRQGRYAEAVACHRRALTLCDDPESHYSLGMTLQAKGELAAAAQSYVDALDRRPDYPEALNNLGNTLREMGQYAEAEACLRQALAQRPDAAQTHYNLARLLQQWGRAAEALAEYEASMTLMPRFAEAAYNRAALLYDSRQIDAAVEAYRELLAWAPGTADAWNNLAKALRERGQASEAALAYERALALKPGDAEVYSNYLFLLQHLDGADGAALLAAHRGYAERFEPAPGASLQPYQNTPVLDRVLRVALVSADFRGHPLANFIEPVLAKHDRAQLSLICLTTSVLQDDTTLRLRSLADGWHSLCGLSDDDAAGLIRGLSIDILIDLSGHTAGNRLGVFLRRPAPLQLTWLGYIGTTGLRVFSGRISDALADPPSLAQAWHSEALLRMPHSQWCYRPHPDAPPLARPPCATNGYLTFGSFNNIAKLSDGLIDLWGRVLASIPSARLLIAGAAPGVSRQRVAERLTQQGIAAGRLDFRQRLGVSSYLALYQEADIALDAYPYQGGTTTCDALWMGVPVLSLTGRRSVARSAASLLGAVGLQDWAVDSPAAYLALARKWADNAHDLLPLREGLRVRIKDSPLMDEPGFMRDWEALLRTAWRAWCEQCGCG